MIKKEITALIVEDVDIALKMAEISLTSLGVKCDIAKNGRDAIKAATSNKYALILLDLGLPDINGFEVLNEIKKGAFCENSFISVITGHVNNDCRQNALKLGANDFIIKPLTLEKTKNLVSKLS